MNRRKEEWKQENIRDQIIAIASGIEGSSDNIKSGVVKGDKAVATADRINRHIKDIIELANMLPPISWSK